jgi:hypothetical protein
MTLLLQERHEDGPKTELVVFGQQAVHLVPALGHVRFPRRAYRLLQPETLLSRLCLPRQMFAALQWWPTVQLLLISAS